MAQAIKVSEASLIDAAPKTKKKAKAKVTKPAKKAAEKKEEKPKAAATPAPEPAADPTAGLDAEDDTGDAPVPTSFNGADEEDVIDNIYAKCAVEAKNAVGESTGEKVVFKEDAQKAGKEIIETLRGIKGQQLTEYMKDHFEEIWANYDVNNDGEISLEESHTF